MAKLKLDEKQTALGLGCFFAIAHAAWALMVGAGFAQGLTDWILGLHFISMDLTIGAFDAMTALMLVIVTFICGAVFGWVFAKIWNWAGTQKYF